MVGTMLYGMIFNYSLINFLSHLSETPVANSNKKHMKKEYQKSKKMPGGSNNESEGEIKFYIFICLNFCNAEMLCTVRGAQCPVKDIVQG